MQYGKLSVGKNVLWESSRMMLPEHREAFVAERKQWGQAVKPLPDEQVTSVWLECLELSFRNRAVIRIVVWEIHREIVKYGYVRAVDFAKQRIQLESLHVSDETGELEFGSLKHAEPRTGVGSRMWICWNDVIGLETIYE